MRREIPGGDPAPIFDRALTLLLRDVGRRKQAEVARPRPRPSGSGSRRSRSVPAHVKRVVWRRDAGQCAFVARNGRRCTERVFLELHHQEPYAIGGEATATNMGLRCRRHNLHEAERVFGPEVVAARVAKSTERRGGESLRRARASDVGRPTEAVDPRPGAECGEPAARAESGEPAAWAECDLSGSRADSGESAQSGASQPPTGSTELRPEPGSANASREVPARRANVDVPNSPRGELNPSSGSTPRLRAQHPVSVGSSMASPVGEPTA